MPLKKTGYISTTQLAKHLGISVVAVFKRIKKGQIKAVKIGRSYAISQSYIQEDFSEAQIPLLDKKYISVIEAAALLNISRVAVFKKIKNGQLQAKRVGRHYVIDKELVLAKKEEVQTQLSKQSKYLSIPQLARALGKSRVTVFKQIKKGEIKAQKIGRHYVIARSDVPVYEDEAVSLEERKETKKYISVAQMAKKLGISRVAVFKKIKKGQIKAIKMGRSYAIPVDGDEK